MTKRMCRPIGIRRNDDVNRPFGLSENLSSSLEHENRVAPNQHFEHLRILPEAGLIPSERKGV